MIPSWQDQIRAIRKSKGLTQKDVAGRLGVKHQHYSRIENGANTQSTKLEDLLEILGCEIIILPIGKKGIVIF